MKLHVRFQDGDEHSFVYITELELREGDLVCRCEGCPEDSSDWHHCVDVASVTAEPDRRVS